jgi:signal transduction histidine kinase
VFNNLIKNALQSGKGDDFVEVKVDITADDENVIISVADNGRGIDPEVQEKIFKPNFTTKSTGMGLGLAIVKNIIVGAKGEIFFETKLGQGTTFIVKLPLVVSN